MKQTNKNLKVALQRGRVFNNARKTNLFKTILITHLSSVI